MLRIFYAPFIVLIIALYGCDAANQSADDSAEAADGGVVLETDGEKLSYGLGMNIGNSVTQQSVPDLNMEALVAGIKDAVDGAEPKVTQEELEAVVGRVQKAEQEKLAKLAEENAQAGVDFLAANASKEGITTTESGLQYEALESGDGASPGPTSKVKTHYHGTLLDGTVFDSSVERGEPVEFGVNQVIPGWTEALQLMKEGDKWRLFVPAGLAYGEFSPGPSIPPNSTLIFEVELIEVVKASEQAAANEEKAEG